MRAVCFDLDDTLYPQAEWLDGAWAAVADRAARDGVDRDSFRAALDVIAAEGTDRGRIIDRALDRVGAAIPIGPLLAAFRTHRAATLTPYPGVRAGLTALAERVPLALVSDGDPIIQRGKLASLGLETAFVVVVWSDEHGREHRKPDPLPFRVAAERLGVAAEDVVVVGDRPAKDVVGAQAAGMRAVRVRTGEHGAQPDEAGTWRTLATCRDACELLLAQVVGGQAGTTATSTRKSSSPGARL